MATLAELEKKKRELQKEKERYQNRKDKSDEKLDQAKKRRKKLESMLKDLKGDFDGNAKTINRHAENIDSNLEDAIKGSTIVKTIGDIIESDKEKEPEQDGDLNCAIGEMNQEIRDLERVESESKNEKSNYSKKISQINSELFDINIEIGKKKLMGDN